MNSGSYDAAMRGKKTSCPLASAGLWHLPASGICRPLASAGLGICRPLASAGLLHLPASCICRPLASAGLLHLPASCICWPQLFSSTYYQLGQTTEQSNIQDGSY
ncbi:hypothetical protein FHG87_022455 [Trinorchestia longiramus]|nr:hypothetical protein FHG87_022455 [Trinorchestia longiramus]